MSSKPATLPAWCTDNVNMTAPDAGRQTTGWNNQDDGISDWDNWKSFWAYKWCEYLRDGALSGDHSIDGALDVIGETTLDVALVDSLQVATEFVCNAFADLANVIQRTGIISPAAIAAQANDWNPTGLSGASIVRMSATGAQSITGMVAPGSGAVVTLINIDASDTITLEDEHAGSSAANRFALPNGLDMTVLPFASVTLWYDSTSSRWRAIGKA